jgi:CcmD family protein
MKRKLFVICCLLFETTNLLAQQTVVEEVPMADQMRADGKIWVVVAVVAVIFAGIIAYLINTDRKLTKLEKQLKK